MPGVTEVSVDYSPRHPEKVEPLATASNLILIDNYDSFTWNVYQYLVLEGANCTVYRNDELSLQELIDKDPTQLVVSPGPGHPDTDGGISNDAIRHFSGKIPVLGVCMGEQCIFTVFGGKVLQIEDIFHGKTSLLRHDGKGLYAGLDPNLMFDVTRYHSLAGTHLSLPDCLEITSRSKLVNVKTSHDGTPAIEVRTESRTTTESRIPDGNDVPVDNVDLNEHNSVIMGVRHKTLVVEGVQFHPESILTKYGNIMIRNFLKMQGGTWAENERLRPSSAQQGYAPNGTKRMRQVAGKKKFLNYNQHSSSSNGDIHTSGADEDSLKAGKQSILEQIFAERQRAIEEQKLIPSQRPRDLQDNYDLGLYPPQIDFVSRLKKSPFPISLMAEIKRASPSKGIISLDISAPAQARKYALAGASVISVLTEPEWFKGHMDDLKAVRQAIEGIPERPCVLCKDFLVDKYHVLLARLAGADSVLLIVKMLDRQKLGDLYHYSRSLGMEPLVEVNTAEEMDIAMRLGARVVGVNNRNLNNFEVDLDTTSRLMQKASPETIICALSGISGAKDIQAYQNTVHSVQAQSSERGGAVGAVLIGEALMRASDTATFIKELFSVPPGEHTRMEAPLVKICGTRNPETAKAAIEAGADLIGMILVEGRSRCVTSDTGKAISSVVHTTKKPQSTSPTQNLKVVIDHFEHTKAFIHHEDRALLVGVFKDQPLKYVLDKQKEFDLDVVQLHGSEPLEWARLIPVPVIRRFCPEDARLLSTRGYHALPLLDSATGGSGKALNIHAVNKILTTNKSLRVVLAGGLDPAIVTRVLWSLGEARHQVMAVDVSSGVEDQGVQSLEKIKAFISAAKRAS